MSCWDRTTYRGHQTWRRPNEATADANPDVGLQDLVGWLPEPVGDGIVGRLLDRELEVWRRRGGFGGMSPGGRRGDGEAAGPGDAGDEDVEPLAGEELGR